MTEVTRILAAIATEPQAAAQLLPLVYDELRRMAAHALAQERPGQTLQPTALVHEAYVRLVGPWGNSTWDHRGHFFAAAAEAMRRILVEHARSRAALKRGGDRQREEQDLDRLASVPAHDVAEILAVHEALAQLAAHAPRRAELVKLRFFLGCTMAEAAQVLGIALPTAEDDWAYAKAWLRRFWSRQGDPPAQPPT